MRFDLHIHSCISTCSEIKPDLLIHRAIATGLEGICITDHTSMGIRDHLKEGVQKNGLVVIFGMEYDTPQGDFLIFGPFEEIAFGMDAFELLEYTENRGGVAIAAHPARFERPLDKKILNAGVLDFIESLNGRNSEIENFKAKQLAEYYSLTEVCGSDSHTLEEIGSVYMEFNDLIRTREDLIFSMKKNLRSKEPVFQSKEKALHL